MYDLMEQEFKKFQKDLFKNDEYLSNPYQENEEENQKEGEEFQLDDDIMKQILDEELKDEKEKDEEKDKNNGENNIGDISHDKKFLEKYDIVLDDEASNEANENEEN
jgi:hypothetical protein